MLPDEEPREVDCGGEGLEAMGLSLPAHTGFHSRGGETPVTEGGMQAEDRLSGSDLTQLGLVCRGLRVSLEALTASA